MLDSFDPNVLLRNRPFDPFGAAAQGMQQGLAMKQNKQSMAMRDQSMQQDKNLMGLDINDPNFLQNALSASPDIARQLIAARLKKELAANKQYQPDNEWVDDPTDSDYQVYMQVKKDPTTGAPISTPIEGMRRHKQYLDRLKNKKLEFEKTLAFKEKEFNQKGKQFTMSNIMDDKKLQVQYAKLKNENVKANLEQAKTQWMFDKAQAGAEVDYDKMKLKAVDALDTIDRMVGNKAKGIKQHPGFDDTVGRKGGALLFGLKDAPFEGTESANFMSLYNKVTGQAFMTAFEGLKGGGQITEMEGQKATDALIEMNTATDEKTFVKAAKRFQKYVRDGLSLAAKEKSLKTPKTLKKTPAPINNPVVPSEADLENMTDEELEAYINGKN